VIVLPIVAAALLIVVLVLRWRHPEKLPNRITPPAGRILFPFIGDSVSRSALDATLRLARAESAVLVPAYIVSVPLHLSLEAPLPRECERALPVLDAIEQQRLLDEEKVDRLVVPAATRTSTGFSPEDIAWLLEEAPGDIVVLRGNGQHHQRAAA